MKKDLTKLPLNLVAGFAKAVTNYSVNQTCFFTIHQPKVPESAKRFKRH